MEKTNPAHIHTKQSGVDPETGTVTWDVTYKADYALVYKTFKHLIKLYKEFSNFDEVIKDHKFKEIQNGLNYLWNQFRTHIRNEYPTRYKLLRPLDEESTTGTGGGFTPGESENYATPFAFNSDKKANGTKNNYYYKLGWKPVKLKEDTQPYMNSLNLQDDSLKQFIETRVSDFDKIEDKLNTLIPLLKKAKTNTMDYYKNNPDFKIKYGTDLAVDYLDDLITLFKDKK